MLRALIAGQEDPEALAELARGRLRKKLPELRRALEGRVKAHHRIVLAQLLAHIDYLESVIAELQAEIERALGPYDEAIELLQTIPGVGPVAAAAIVAEIGVDMGRFPSGRHLASWSGVRPGNKQRGGKRLGGKTTNGNVWLRAMLSECAWASARGKTGYLAAQFRRLARRRGAYKALVAVAHSLLVSIYHVLRDRRPYADLGADHFDKLDVERVERHHVRRQNALGYSVTLTALPPPDPVPA
jgi:transposase